MTRHASCRFARLWTVSRSMVSAAAIVVLCADASAQTPECDRYRAELASLGPGGGQSSQQAAEAQRVRGDLDRMRSYHAQIGCARGGGGFFFNQPPPQECGALANRIRQAEGNLNQLMQQASTLDGGVGERRRQLTAYINQACRGGGAEAAAQRPPNFFEQLFGGGQQNQVVRQPDGPIIDDGQAGGPLGGSRVVCVRTCDGYFFPLPGGGREGATEMCQALCPEAETQVFYMSPNGDIERGVSATGQPYLSLANASRYKKAVVPNCACRKEGEKWVDALRRAEDLLGRRQDDLVVTAQKAEELSRPKAEAPKKAGEKSQADQKGKKAAAPVAQQPAVVEQEADQPVDPAQLPTAGKESAGIGPQNVGNSKTVGQREGQVQEVTGADGKKQKVRIVAPNMFVGPQAK